MSPQPLTREQLEHGRYDQGQLLATAFAYLDRAEAAEAALEELERVAGDFVAAQEREWGYRQDGSFPDEEFRALKAAL